MKDLGIILSLLLLFMLYYTIKSITKLSDEIKKINIHCEKKDKNKKTNKSISTLTKNNQNISPLSQMFIDIIQVLDKLRK